MNDTKNTSIYSLVVAASTEEDYKELQIKFEQGGYALFSKFLRELREQLKLFQDDNIVAFTSLLAKAKRIVPAPGKISPSWEYVWDDFDQMTEMKQEVMKKIPPAEREGEWQVIMDNPYSHAGVVCHPGLSFMDAAYLYAYFGLELMKNEYLRLQKIEQVMSRFGE